jgi:pyrroline-5-carboxylate reductase
MDIGGPLVLVGCGKMGGALLDGWLTQGVAPESVTLVEPQAALSARFAGQGVGAVAEAGMLPAALTPAVVVLAIKPQQMDAALPNYARFARPGTVFLSAIVRAMPNTPAAVGRGMTVLCANAAVSAAQRELCGGLLAAVGETAWVEDEGLLDPVTAVSGGGPAYVFLLIECLAEAGEAAGLPADLAMRLARVTVAGAGELVHRAEEPAASLRENVTSPAGTTLEALKVLMAPDGLQPLMTRAIAEATRRSRELAS